MKYLQKMSAGFILLGNKEIIGIFSLPNIFLKMILQRHTLMMDLKFWMFKILLKYVFSYKYKYIYISTQKKVFWSSLYPEETWRNSVFNRHKQMMEESIFVKDRYKSLKEI